MCEVGFHLKKSSGVGVNTTWDPPPSPTNSTPNPLHTSRSSLSVSQPYVFAGSEKNTAFKADFSCRPSAPSTWQVLTAFDMIACGERRLPPGWRPDANRSRRTNRIIQLHKKVYPFVEAPHPSPAPAQVILPPVL